MSQFENNNKSATAAGIAAQGHVLTPDRNVGTEEVADDGEQFEERTERLSPVIEAQFRESAELERAFWQTLKPRRA